MLFKGWSLCLLFLQSIMAQVNAQLASLGTKAPAAAGAQPPAPAPTPIPEARPVAQSPAAAAPAAAATSPPPTAAPPAPVAVAATAATTPGSGRPSVFDRLGPAAGSSSTAGNGSGGGRSSDHGSPDHGGNSARAEGASATAKARVKPGFGVYQPPALGSRGAPGAVGSARRGGNSQDHSPEREAGGKQHPYDVAASSSSSQGTRRPSQGSEGRFLDR
jgi:hypothetical protein